MAIATTGGADAGAARNAHRSARGIAEPWLMYISPRCHPLELAAQASFRSGLPRPARAAHRAEVPPDRLTTGVLLNVAISYLIPAAGEDAGRSVYALGDRRIVGLVAGVDERDLVAPSR